VKFLVRNEDRCPVCPCGVLCYGQDEAEGIIFCDTCLTYFHKDIKDGVEVLIPNG